MKIALVADNHFKNRERLGVVEDSIDSRLVDKVRSLSAVVDHCMANDVRLLCHLGDCFDRPNPGDSVRALVAEVLGRYIEWGGRVLAVIGNHERVGQVSPWQSEALVSSSMTVFAHPAWYPVENGRWILCLPESRDSYDEDAVHAMLKDGMEKCQCAPTLVIGHGSISGAYATPQYQVEGGWSPSFLEGLGAPLALFGHFHKHQFMHSTNFTCGYVGCLNRQDFGERAYETGFVIVEWVGRGRPMAEHISVPDRPMLQFDWVEGEAGPGLWSGTNDEALVKVRLKGTAAWLHSNTVQDHLRAIEKHAHKTVIEFDIVKERVTMSLATRGFSIDTAFETYVTENRVDAEAAKLGKEILEVVRADG